MNPVESVACRGATVGDLPRLLPVVREFYDHFGFAWNDATKEGLLRRLMGDPRLGRVWVAPSGADVAGYALVALYFSLEFDGPVALLDELYVSRTHRGRGLGEQLVNGAARELAAEGVYTLRLELDQRHPEAAGLYARLGFTRDGRESWTRRHPVP